MKRFNTMIKKLFSIMLVACALYSCTESIQSIEDESPAVADNLKEVTLNMGFEITTSPMKAPLTRAKSAADAVSRIAVSIFDENDTEVFVSSQRKGDNNFGAITTKLQPGAYKVVIAGTSTTDPTVPCPFVNGINNVKIFGNAVLATYAAVHDLTVTAENSQVFNVEVPPVVTVLEMISTDEIPSNINSLKVTVSPDNSDVTDYALNPATGFVQNSGKKVVDVAKKYIKKDEMFLQNKLFIQTGETTKVIHVDMLDANGQTVRSRDLTKVPFTLGKTTVVRGAFFSGDITGSFTFGDWDSDVNLYEF